VKRREKKREKEKRQQKLYFVFAPLWQEKLKIVFIRKKITNKGQLFSLLN
jgi:hypothetical protein